ncbi:MAG TPA: serine hydrolase domain-containing protein [Polyangiaceae bacterium]
MSGAEAIDAAAHVARGIEERGAAPAAAAGCACRVGSPPLPPTPTDTPWSVGAMSAWVRDVGGKTSLYFDLASVTKPMTAVAAVRAGIEPSTPLGALLDEARGTASEGIPLELFLAHRAGLAGHRALYAPLVRGERVDVPAALHEAAGARREDALGDARLLGAAGFEPVYSDLGYALAGEAIARAIGARDAGEAIGRLVLEPLGIADQAGTIRDLAVRGIAGPFAPTEDVPWRGGLVSGAVHDENAWALTGLGGSGHAGIFGTIAAVLTFGTAVLDGLAGRGVFGDRGPDSLAWLVRPRPGGTLRAGFDGKSEEGSSAGVRLGPNAFGHLGFTGTSLWLDPDAAIVVALLTNRVCPSREHRAIREERPRAHDSLFDRAVLLRKT